MYNYRAYLLGNDGGILSRVDMVLCENDEVAKHQAKLLVDGHAVELWDGGRKIATFEPPGGMQLLSTLTCPHCQHQATETMPTDACQFFYDCNGCGERLKPKPGDCCVFCSYGSVACPPIQIDGKEAGCC